MTLGPSRDPDDLRPGPLGPSGGKDPDAPVTPDSGREMLDFLGVHADPELLRADLTDFPDGRPPSPVAVPPTHDRLVAAGSLLTGSTLIGGIALLLLGAGELAFGGGGAISAALAVLGFVLAATHWGWVHVAEYAGLTIDDRHHRLAEQGVRSWLENVQPYPRLTVTTSVLDDASTRIESVRYRPVLTPRNTFSFVRETEAQETYDADTPAAEIAAAVEAQRRRGRLQTDRLRELWEDAATTYAAALHAGSDDQQRLSAKRAAATALSEHLNASLREPPLIE